MPLDAIKIFSVYILLIIIEAHALLYAYGTTVN